MKLKHILFLVLLSPILLNAQTLRLAIQNEGKFVYYATIEVNNSFYSTTSTNHVFNIPIKSKDIITIKHEIYEDYKFKIIDGLKPTDTINKLVSLTLKPENMKLQMLDEFTITDSKYRNVFDNQDEFIIDYYPFPLNHFFIITKFKKEHFIKVINRAGDEIYTKILKIKPEEIFLDAIGNFHLIEKDSVYQFYTQNKNIQLMKGISKEDFEINIKNLVTLGNNGAFHQKISMHNQMYSLIRIIDKEVTDIYQSLDHEGYENAAYHYNSAVAYYMRHQPVHQNIITMGLWDGKLMSLNNYSFELFVMTSWSDNIASQPLDVLSFGLNDNIVVLDGVRDSIFQIDNETFSLKKNSAKFSFSGEYFKDYFYDNIYMYTKDKQGVIVSKINLEDGTITNIAQLSDMRQPRNIKVINDKVYFTKLDESQYNRIVEVKKQ
ncbi:hypothetical protein [Brumimicrobium mesophilum]|uniref:hypothetical protein n=1 Tax=Brumimicrobium mesophilum TaxID=392717 RepID=UPI000D144B44|nr:hypothetical protein [Brumimicrobium mesophilum]